MNQWTAQCSHHGQVNIQQKTKPTSCKELIQCGPRSIRQCGNRLSDQQCTINESEIALDISRFEWMLKARASVYRDNSSDWFLCQFNTVHFTRGKTERQAIDKAMQEHATLSPKAKQ